MIVVVNTSPLIGLDRIGRLALLPQLFGNVIRPQSVIDELLAGKNVYGGSSELFHAGWMETHADPPEVIFRKELGAGETAAIVLAKKLSADLVLLDDLIARNVAKDLGLKVSGTLGVLLAAYRKGIIEHLDKELDALVSCGFRLSEQMRNTLLTESQ